MAGKSVRLYNDSPSLKRDKDSGSVSVKKPSEADAQDMGIEGNELEGGGDGMPVEVHQAVSDMHGRHEKEMKDMHKRHDDEHKIMNKRHIKELKGLASNDNGKDIDKD